MAPLTTSIIPELNTVLMPKTRLLQDTIRLESFTRYIAKWPGFPAVGAPLLHRYCPYLSTLDTLRALQKRRIS